MLKQNEIDSASSGDRQNDVSYVKLNVPHSQL